ncbi:uncharacterized protein LOC116517219 [Thamnophis elegans]|uniref:uncharacterized protein LOC116517219 n=1 Tax=Thamnophis elegans TaxID=35005 RepID=UPI0013785C7F|nr:uncharacterized protein LOC116517219 [Thamnophis elegans]
MDAVKYASRALSSSVASRRLLWLHHWQAESRTKWHLAGADYAGDKLFVASLDPILVEDKNKRKVFPATTRRSDHRHALYPRRTSYCPPESDVQNQRDRALGSPTRQGASVVPASIPESRDERHQLQNLSVTSGAAFAPLVAAQALDKGTSEEGTHNGHEPVWLGSTPGDPDSPGTLDSNRPAQQHKLVGAQGYPSGPSSLQDHRDRSPCPGLDGQRGSQGPREQARGHTFQGPSR